MKKPGKYKNTISYFYSIIIFLFFINNNAFADNDTLQLLPEHSIADSLFELKEYEQASHSYQKAADLYHSKKKWEQEVICLNAIGNALRKNHQYDEAIEILNKSINLGLTHLNEANAVLAETFHLKFFAYYYKGDYYQAGFAEEEAIRRYRIIYGDKSHMVAKAFNNLGVLNKNIGRFDRAMAYFEQALSISEQVLDSLHPDIASTINNLSIVYTKKGDYDKALSYSKRALNITLNTYPVDSIKLASKYNNIGLIYIEIPDTVEAYNFFKLALDIRIKILEKDHPDIAGSYNNMGLINRVKGKYDIALSNYFKALKIYQKIFNEDHPDIAMCYSNISSIYFEQGDFDQAIFFNSKALSIRTEIFHKNHPNVAKCYLKFGDIYMRMGQLASSNSIAAENYNKALNYFELAIQANTLDGKILSNKEQLSILSEKANVFIHRYHSITNDTVELLNALTVYKEISSLVDDLRKSYESKGSMLALSKLVSESFLKAINTAYQLYNFTNNNMYLNTAFFFAEKNKANVLVEAMLEARSQTYSGILDSLMEEEEKIKSALLQCDNNRQKEIFNKGKRNSERIAEIEKEYVALNNSYDNLINVFEKNYQNYFLLKYSTSTLSIQDVQQVLSPQSAVIEYITSDSSLYIFLITKTESSLTKISTDSIDLYINNLRKALSELSLQKLNNTSIKNYCYYANQLYNLLLSPIENRLDVNDIIIIPDGKLGYIPYEVLLSKAVNDLQVDFKTLPYLINNYSISYGNSATIHFDLLQSLKCNAEKDFFGIAPFTQKSIGSKYFYDKDTINLVSLPSSKYEVESIQKILGGKIILGSDATKQNFVSEAVNYKILHIATHGVINDKHPLESCLFFNKKEQEAENTLKIIDLFGMTFNADLVVLSACNTGYGQLEKGEGIMSLARGFSYTGVSGIAMSLWNVNDKSTSTIMKSFYEYLQEGYLKNEALRQAKLDYIQQSDNIFATPYYWGSFIYIGKNDVIELSKDKFNYWLFLFIIPVLLLGGYFYKKVQQRT